MIHQPLSAEILILDRKFQNADAEFKVLQTLAKGVGVPIQYEAQPLAPITLVCRPWRFGSEADFWDQEIPATPPLYLMLDQVTDPHNLGACLRSAEASGVDAVFIPEHGRAPLTEVVLQTSSGAAASIPCFEVKNFARFMERLQQAGCWIMGADVQGSGSLYELDLTGPVVLVLGSEGKGLRALTRTHCDHLFRIPMKGQVESLNVSVATGIVLFEALRQRIPSEHGPVKK